MNQIEIEPYPGVKIMLKDEVCHRFSSQPKWFPGSTYFPHMPCRACDADGAEIAEPCIYIDAASGLCVAFCVHEGCFVEMEGKMLVRWFRRKPPITFRPLTGQRPSYGCVSLPTLSPEDQRKVLSGAYSIDDVVKALKDMGMISNDPIPKVVSVTPADSWNVPPVVYEPPAEPVAETPKKVETWRDRPAML